MYISRSKPSLKRFEIIIKVCKSTGNLAVLLLQEKNGGRGGG